MERCFAAWSQVLAGVQQGVEFGVVVIRIPALPDIARPLS
jgi:hypothetical protein